MYYRILATLALSFVFYVGSSQISYHRLYETTLDDTLGINDTIFYHMASTTLSGDVYAMGTKRLADLTDIDDLSIIFTKHNDKGNIDWSKELDLGRDSVEIKSICDFQFNGAQDSILFVIDVEINGERKEIFGRLEKSGNEIDLHSVEGFQVFSGLTRPNVVPFINQSDLLMTPASQPIISRIGLGDDLMWSNSYEFVNSEGDSILNYFSDINSTPDSTIVALGLGRNIGEEFVVAELDSNGVQIWAESYTFPINNLRNIAPIEAIPLVNGDFAVIGEYFLMGSFESNAFITVIDSSGSVLMSKKLIVAENSTNLLNILQGADGTLWMTGIAAVNDTSTYFTTNMDLDGLINWTTFYHDQEPGLSAYSTSLIPVQATGGATFVGHGFKDDLAVMQVMKHDAEGKTPCSDTTTTIVEDLMITADTLFSQVENIELTFDTLVYEFDDFSGFSPPTLTINYQYPAFCPNELIDTFLIAVVDQVDTANISYIWSTGEINDTIRVIAEGQYSVTVTISEDVCYTMCDTIELTRLMLPEIAITQDNSRFCEEGIIVLTGNYTPGAPNETYLWNTLETTPSIEVTDPGVYSVTVTDECGEMASDELDLSLPDINPSVSISAGDCINGQTILSAFFIGVGNNPQFIWSTNETTDNISVSTEGTYSVSVTDECGGDEATAEITFEFTNDLELSIFEASSFDIICNFPPNPDNGHKLDALLQGTSNPSYTWSTGETGSTIYALADGTYSVTATDECGQMLTESIDVDVKEIPESGDIDFTLECDENDIALSRITFTGSANIDNAIIKLDVFDAEDGTLISDEVIPTEPLVLGNYFVVLSTCDLVELDTLRINAEILCGGLLNYPIAFFPGGQDDASKTFGPIPNDTLNVERISNVDFKVFNRWGETVFESSAILEAWDGSHKGEPAPSEVYIWYVAYSVDGQQMLDKGDVTLIR